MILERADNIINIMEMKYSEAEYTLLSRMKMTTSA